MSRRLSAVLLCTAALAFPLMSQAQTPAQTPAAPAQTAAAAPAAAGRLTPERVFAEPDLNGRSARGVQLSPDGQLVTFLRPRADDRNTLDLWAADVKGGEPRILVDARKLAPEQKELSEAEKARRERMRISSRGVVGYDWDEQGKAVLVPLEGDLYLAQRADGSVKRLTTTAADEIDAKVSSKGRYVSFVRDQNLYLIDVASGAERAMTTDGKGVVSWAVAEFVAQEEMNRDTGYWWSPDETRIALTRVDETPVDIIPRLDIGATGATVIDQRYPRAGRPNAIVDLFIQDVASGRMIPVDLGPSKDIYLARVNWSKDGKILYVQRQSRDQQTLDLLAIDPATGKGPVIVTQKSDSWVELADDFKPLTGGGFLWSNEDSGARHLYLYDAGGKLVRAVTKGPLPIGDLRGVDEARKVALISASLNTPIEQQLYEVSYERPAAPRALTSGKGWWNASVAPTGGAFVASYSDGDTPAQTALYDRAGKRVRWIEENKLDASHPFAPFQARKGEERFGVLKAADGTDLHYSMLLPPGFDPAKTYPVILSVYGGPHVQTVRRGWVPAEGRLWGEAGYIVFKLDNRGSWNRDVKFTRALYRQLGKVETADQLVGVKWLKAQPFVDPARIGVSGWSYGGIMTLNLLTEPGAGLAAGVSGAPPTDWSLYDTHYTEQFMSKPEDNVEGYKQSDVLNRLDKLNGRLLLMHGMADDNVIFANSTRLLAALQERSIPFETMLYPGERHGIRGNAKRLGLIRTQLDFFNRTLKPTPAP